MTVKVLNNQRLIDLCMQEYGTPDKLFEAAQAVGLSVTDELDGINELDMPVLDFTAFEKAISTVLKKPLNIPASADDDAIDYQLPPGGIGYMKIKRINVAPAHNDFIVS